MYKFNVTYETITPESAENGDTETAGFVIEDCSLRCAIDYLGSGDQGCEANEYPVSDPRWITMYNVDMDYGTDETINRSMHFPDNMTPASKLRVARLLSCHGV